MTKSVLIVKEEMKPQISDETCPCLWYKLKGKLQQRDDFDSSSYNFKKKIPISMPSMVTWIV